MENYHSVICIKKIDGAFEPFAVVIPSGTIVTNVIEELNLMEIVNLTSEKDDDSNYDSLSKSDTNSDSNTNNSSQKVFQLNIMVLLILLLY